MNHELTAAAPWMARHAVRFEWNAESLDLRASLTKSDTGRRFYVRGLFDEYRVLPPRWTFTDAAGSGEYDGSNYPLTRCPGRAAMCITHQNKPVICAPFNRLAYQDLAGPHGDWGGPAAWQSVNTGVVRATHVGDMLAALQRETDRSDGTLAGTQ